jgi:HlyD family secretion protein
MPRAPEEGSGARFVDSGGVAVPKGDDLSRRWIHRILIPAGVVAVIVVLRLTVLRPAPVPVTVYRVALGRVEDTVVNSRAGTVKSRLRAQMSPGLAGLVAEIPVKKGEAVHKGEVVLRLDDREYRAQLVLAERSLDAARANAKEACLTAEQAARDRQRTEELARQGLAAAQTLEQARTNAETAAAACSAAREGTKQAQASVAVARATLDKTAMIAPFNGVVLDVTAEVGEWISPSPPGVFIPPVVDLIDPHSLYVSAPLDEADVAKVRVGLPVRITMDAFRGQSFPGTISYVSSYVETAQEQNRTLTVEAVFDQKDLPPNLLPGLSADIEVILGAKDGVLRIPTYALLEGDRVLLVKGDHLESVKVKTGLHNWEFTEVTSGLSAGDRVVVSLDRPEVKAGARVRVVGETEK